MDRRKILLFADFRQKLRLARKINKQCQAERWSIAESKSKTT
uniref:Uncharacterized protein n=1 Tax=Tetranychus urticae TaxID=32264 RepID=T1JX78_TETUR